MHEVVESRRQQIQALCRDLSVRRLDVFGSAVSGSFDVDTSDVDVLVEFEGDQILTATSHSRIGLKRSSVGRLMW